LRAVDLTAAYGGPGVECDERQNKNEKQFLAAFLFSRSSHPTLPAEPGSQIDGAAANLRELPG
jgi:hypothetical protein